MGKGDVRAWPLKKPFFEDLKKFWIFFVVTKLEVGGGVKALVAGPLKKYRFLRLPLAWSGRKPPDPAFSLSCPPSSCVDSVIFFLYISVKVLISAILSSFFQ